MKTSSPAHEIVARWRLETQWKVVHAWTETKEAQLRCMRAIETTAKEKKRRIPDPGGEKKALQSPQHCLPRRRFATPSCYPVETIQQQSSLKCIVVKAITFLTVVTVATSAPWSSRNPTELVYPFCAASASILLTFDRPANFFWENLYNK